MPGSPFQVYGAALAVLYLMMPFCFVITALLPSRSALLPSLLVCVITCLRLFACLWIQFGVSIDQPDLFICEAASCSLQPW
jgi:hypothetical protein